MEYEIETYPDGKSTEVSEQDLPEAYAALHGAIPPTVSCGDEDQQVLVAVGEDRCAIALLDDDTWYWLTVPAAGGEEEVPFLIGGADSSLPRKALAPRDLGLEVLLKAGDFTALTSEYTWEEQGPGGAGA